MFARPRLVVFAKAPQPGLVKTRLISALGAQGAADLARRMLQHTLQQALAAHVGTVELCMSPAPSAPAWAGVSLPAGVECCDQGPGDLGQRMARAVDRVTDTLAQPILLMGTDCPALSAAHIAQAAQQLQHHDAVLVPVADGGYVLIGLHAPCPSVFADDMAWSTAVVAGETLRRWAALGHSVWTGPMLHDIDEPGDLVHVPLKWRFGPKGSWQNAAIAPVKYGD
ncbi:TIGR04282 family arsenosugar biosynthesis glycosyltransferase [Rhodoferax sp. AJA081-3]|nr:TIGR04282 family arsenosugar biosynthesis glycosyltransferase [Rhodoferax sp. AJA081-3]